METNDNMAVDESVNSSKNNASITINESTQTKLFPVFVNETPLSSHINQ